MIPLDGDVLSFFYRRDILEHFNLKVPRTWDEYAEVAEAVHGKTYNGTTLSGSCVGRVEGCVGSYWANLVHSSYTQSGGTKTGHMFNPRDMSPLAGEALAETIRQLEIQNKFGVKEEFEGCCCGEEGINIKHFLDGSCAMTYNWGDNYKIHFSEDSEVGGLVGVAQTPGSTRVLDRETGKLVDCDAERCRYGEWFEDIGWVNRAPYAAFAGGWAAAVAENAPPVQQRLAADFFAYASSFERSSIGIIPNATGPLSSFNGQDPFRTSHFELSKWLEKGYPEEGTINYRDTVAKSLNSENLVVDIRFPESDTIMGILDKKIHAYLQRVKNNEMTDTESQRQAVAEEIANEWRNIVEEFDNDRPIGSVSLLENYQRDLGVYVPPQDFNYIGNARWFGWSLAILVILTSLGFAAWVTVNRKIRVVKASQPIFLQLICVGTLLMASSIFPLGIDDEIASQRGCNISCMAIPWLFGCGFSCVFAALFAKTQRVIQVFKAPNFTRITVTVLDVIKPFVALLMINIALLLAWTLADPYIFVRCQS